MNAGGWFRGLGVWGLGFSVEGLGLRVNGVREFPCFEGAVVTETRLPGFQQQLLVIQLGKSFPRALPTPYKPLKGPCAQIVYSLALK